MTNHEIFEHKITTFLMCYYETKTTSDLKKQLSLGDRK